MVCKRGGGWESNLVWCTVVTTWYIQQHTYIGYSNRSALTIINVLLILLLHSKQSYMETMKMKTYLHCYR